MFALQNGVAPCDRYDVVRYRLSMFALQRVTFLAANDKYVMLPLEHVRVATSVDIERILRDIELPLEHVRVATLVASKGYSPSSTELPLEHVRVATSEKVAFSPSGLRYRLSMFALQLAPIEATRKLFLTLPLEHVRVATGLVRNISTMSDLDVTA